MADLILHHFDLSPFAEKARLMLGFKGLAWHSVEIPMIMPKPDLTVLTGGYRKTPVLQIGADIFCDTRLIATVLEDRHPRPSFFPHGNRGLSQALAAWADRPFFEPGAGLSMALNRRGLPAAVIDDRKAFFNFMDFDTLEQQVPHLTTQLRAQADLVEQQLSDGRPYLLGNEPGLADIHAYFPIWMARGHIAIADRLLAPFARMAPWEARMRQLGHGRRMPSSAAEAHAAARDHRPMEGVGVDAADPLGLTAGEPVCVSADDYGKDPVRGRLESLSLYEVAVRREAPGIGTVVVHFPRIGYRIVRERS